MKVASYNIHKCRGVDGVTRPDRIVEVIRELGADVVALQEVDRRFGAAAACSTRWRSSVKPGCGFWRSRTFLTATAGTAMRCSCAETQYLTGVHA